MGTFGSEFWNVRDESDRRVGTGSGQLHPAPNDGVAPAQVELQAFIDAANGPATPPTPQPNRGGIVYLPPGTYRIGSIGRTGLNLQDAINAPDLTVRANVLLWFAPGAKLLLDPEVVVLFQHASIRAEARQIFESAPLDTPDGRRGKVVFGTTKIPEVYPEWWGARSFYETDDPTADESNIVALEDCVRAAHTDRRWTSAHFPVIPIVLRGEYPISREWRIEPQDVTLTSGVSARFVAGAENPDGIVLRGQRGTGSTGTGVSNLLASDRFQEATESMARGRALLCVNGLHGSIVEGINFEGRARASVCVQVTGPAQLSVFRNCAFRNSRHVLVQVGDYVIEDMNDDPMTRMRVRIPARDSGISLPRLDSRVRANLDLSGLSFEHCLFTVDATPALAPLWDRLVGLVFHAHETLPMTLDQCKFSGPMLACVEAYGGALIIRGGTAQNHKRASPYVERRGSELRRDRPRGGVDIFIGDPLLTAPGNAIRPTALTVFEFQSQSDQFLDTFRHLSASVGNIAFQPTVLQGVTHNVTTDGSPVAPPAIFWSGPAISTSGLTARAGSLTLVGCTFAGPRTNTEDRVGDGSSPPSGAIVVHQLALGTVVADVGTASEYTRTDSTNLFYQYNPMGGGAPLFQQLSGDRLSAFPWYRKL